MTLNSAENQQIARKEQHARACCDRVFTPYEVHRRGDAASQIASASAASFSCSYHDRLHADRRDQLHLMTELPERPTPLVRARARLDREDASGVRRNEAQHLVSAQLLPEGHRPLGPGAVKLKLRFASAMLMMVARPIWMPPSSR